MQMRDTTVIFLCAFLGVMVLMFPLPVFGGPHEDIGPGEVEWHCSMPLWSLAPPEVDLDAVRDKVADARAAASTSGQSYVPPHSPHPMCGGLARTQVVLGLLALAGAVWKGRSWWKTTADARAERRFKRLHESVGASKNRSRIFG